MKSSPDNPPSAGSLPPAVWDETLRLLAQAPVPVDLEQRLQAALRAEPRHGRVLRWTHAAATPLSPGASAWMRTAAAAAIVFVVAGGGYGIYHRVQGPAAKSALAPVVQPAAAPGGFSSAGAIRTPNTVKGPVLVQPAAKPPVVRRRKKIIHKPSAAIRPSHPPTVEVEAVSR